MTPATSKPHLVTPSGRKAPAVSASPVIHFGAVHLASSGVQLDGQPEFDDWKDAVLCAAYFEEKSPKWLAQLMLHGRDRSDWGDLIYSVLDAGRFTKKSLGTYLSTAKKIDGDWVEGVSFSHHQAAVSLPAGERRKILNRAKREHLSVPETRALVRKERKVSRVLKGQSSELSKLQDVVTQHAVAAADHCKDIYRADCAKAEAAIKKARYELDGAEVALIKLRKGQGKK